MSASTAPYVHPTAIVEEGAILGSGCKIWHFCHVMPGAQIGARSSIGQNGFVGKGVKIGAGCKLQNNISVYERVELEDDVFVGPSAVFTNVRNPRAFIERKNEYQLTLIRKGVSIGANATIVCGVTVGRFAFIGAGAVVTKDVPEYGLILGNPGRRKGWVSRAGRVLGADLRCPETGEQYAERDGVLAPIGGKDQG